MADQLSIHGYLEKIRRRFNVMRKGAILTDVVLTCNGRRFDAHRSYLSAASNYFFQMFNTEMRESTESAIDFPCIESQTLSTVLEILYTGNLCEVEYDDLLPLLKALHSMQLDSIYSSYRAIYLTYLSIENLMAFWDSAEDLNDDVILTTVLDLMYDRISKVNFSLVSESKIRRFIEYILGKEYLSHDFLLLIIIRWVARRKREKQTQKLLDLIKYIDFDKVQPSEIVTYLKDNNAKTSDTLFENILASLLTTCEFLFSHHSLDVMNYSFMLLLGKDDTDQYWFQKCKMGIWGESSALFDNSSEILDIDCVEDENGLHVATKEVIEGKMLLRISLLTQDCRNVWAKDSITISETAKLSMTKFYKSILLTDYDEGYKRNTFLSLDLLQEYRKRSYRYTLREKIKKIETFVAGGELYQVVQEEQALKLWRYSFVVNEWEEVVSNLWDSTEIPSSWFAFYSFPHITIRSFPGDSRFYTLEGVLQHVSKNNGIPNVVSLDVFGSGVWVLTDDGKIFVQDLKTTNGPWRFVAKSQEPLTKYRKLILVRNSY